MSWKSYVVSAVSPLTVHEVSAPMLSPVRSQPISADDHVMGGVAYLSRYRAGLPVPSPTWLHPIVIVESDCANTARSATALALITAEEGCPGSIGESAVQAAIRAIANPVTIKPRGEGNICARLVIIRT